MRIYQSIRELVDRLWFELRVALKIDQRYLVGEIFVKLPPDHLLPLYQRTHKNYDRFLPHLAKYLPRQSIVVDVGANCGDTVAAMASANDDLHYVCIEADETFFKYLESNIGKIESKYKSIVCEVHRQLIGKSVSNVIMEGTGGTKRAIASHGIDSLRSKTLDEVLEDFDPSRISLIKSDVDGYDYDVINSAESILEACDPFLYFECQYENKQQLDGYFECLGRIDGMGYSNFALFDNFGGLICESIDRPVLRQFLSYVWRQNREEAMRTIYYFDVLAYNTSHKELVSSVLRDY